MNRIITLSYFFKTVNSCPKQSGAAYFSFLCKDISKIPIRFCSSKVTSQKNEIEQTDSVDLKEYDSKFPNKFNFSMVADKSPLIQKYIDLGVNLYEIEKNPPVANYLLTLSFEKLKSYLFFLTDNGVSADKLGQVITKHPTIFKEDLGDLEVRVNYLKAKNFDKTMIATILTSYPKWLSTPVKQVDERLGYLQETYNLKGDQVRSMITKVPSLVNVKKDNLMSSLHALKEEMNLDKYTLKSIILSEPSLLRKSTFDLLSTYDYLVKKMNVPVALIIKQPKALTYRKFFWRDRHTFLESLGKAQYNNFLPGYVSLLSLVETSDEEFCRNIAKTSLDMYNNFLKTL